MDANDKEVIDAIKNVPIEVSLDENRILRDITRNLLDNERIMIGRWRETADFNGRRLSLAFITNKRVLTYFPSGEFEAFAPSDWWYEKSFGIIYLTKKDGYRLDTVIDLKCEYSDYDIFLENVQKIFQKKNK